MKGDTALIHTHRTYALSAQSSCIKLAYRAYESYRLQVYIYKDCIASLKRFLKLSLHHSICLQPPNPFRITVCRKAYSQYN